MTRVIILCACFIATASGCRRDTVHFYPSQNASDEERDSRDTSRVKVLFGDEQPNCAYEVLGLLRYDWATDGVITTEERAIAGLREAAGEYGATGIFQLEQITGADVQVGQQAVVAQVVGDTSVGFGAGTRASTQEVGMQATIYVCDAPLTDVDSEGL